jgi:hypothetical protein
MEADWEFEVGSGAPVIEARWPGFIDLRLHPGRAHELSETAGLPALADALQSLNSNPSPVWTSKCDVWPVLRPEHFDADEMAAPTGRALHAMACYLDMLPRKEGSWDLPAQAEAACRKWCAAFHAVPLSCCRVDLVIRRAFVSEDRESLGITAYLTACGAKPVEARGSLEGALRALVGGVCGASTIQ